MFMRLDTTLDFPSSPQVSSDSAADYLPPVLDISERIALYQQPTLSSGGFSGTVTTVSEKPGPRDTTSSYPSGGTLRRTGSNSSRVNPCRNSKQTALDASELEISLENEVLPKLPASHGKPQLKKLKDRMKPASFNAVPPSLVVADHPHKKLQSTPISAPDTHLEEFFIDATKGAKSGLVRQQTRRALADIWANASTFPKGLDISEDFDRPNRKRAKCVENEISQAGVNTPLTRKAPDVPLLSLQEFWAQATSLNRPSVSLAAPAAPPGLQINTRTISASQTRTRTDNHGRVQLGADDLYMLFTYDKSPHFEFWDMQDDAYLLCAAQVNLLAIHPAPYRYTSLPLPQIKMLDIQCYTQDLNTTLSVSAPEHIINYTGARTRDDKNNNIPVVPAEGIAVEPEWIRVTRFGGARESNKRGWCLNIYVPIPAKLFVKKETRTFILRASVWIGDEKEIPVGAAEEITVSHLRKEREMF